MRRGELAETQSSSPGSKMPADKFCHGHMSIHGLIEIDSFKCKRLVSNKPEPEAASG